MPRLPLSSKLVMTIDIARALVDVAEREIAARKFSMYVAIVDDSGVPLIVERLNDGQSASFEIALAKARAAAGFRRPTKVFEDRVLIEGRVNALSMPGILAVEGGVPLLFDGRIVGAIGVSGGTSAEDGQVAAVVAARLLEIAGNSTNPSPGPDTAADHATERR